MLTEIESNDIMIEEIKKTLKSCGYTNEEISKWDCGKAYVMITYHGLGDGADHPMGVPSLKISRR